MSTGAWEWDKFLRDLDELPTHPAVAQRLVEVMGNERALSSREIEISVLDDPATTIKVLRLANSELFGKPGRIATISHAIALLDCHIARLAALSFTLPNASSDGLETELERCWRDSWLLSACAAHVARHFPEVNVDEARAVALIADIGSLALLHGIDLVQKMASNSQSPQPPVSALDVTKQLLRRWGLPPAVISAVDVHRKPQEIETLAEHSRELAKVLFLARQIVEHVSGGPVTAEALCVWFDSWARVEPPIVAEIVARASVLRERAREIFAPVDRSPDQIREQARRSLLSVTLSTVKNLTETARQAEIHERRAFELEMQRDKLTEQVTLDPVLNIGNRRYFDTRLVEELKRGQRNGQPISLILFDLDYFKQLNDTFGHPAGDEALKATAETIAKCLRTSDVFCRYGGEEFAVICPETDLSGAVSLAERMRVCLEHLEVCYRAQILQTTASFGVATLEDTDDGIVSSDLLEMSDSFLFEAKRAGRNCVRFGLYIPRSRETA